MPSLVSQNETSVIEKLAEIENDYKKGYLTAKGYCKKKWELLKPLAEKSVIDEVEKLQCILQVHMQEDEFVKKLKKILNNVDVMTNGGKESNGTKCLDPGENVSNDGGSVVKNGPSLKSSERNGTNSNAEQKELSSNTESTNFSKSYAIKNGKDMESSTVDGNDHFLHGSSKRRSPTNRLRRKKDYKEYGSSDSGDDSVVPLSIRRKNEADLFTEALPGPSSRTTPKSTKKSLSTSKAKKKPQGRSAYSSQSLTSYFPKEEKPDIEQLSSPTVKKEEESPERDIKEEEEEEDSDLIPVKKIKLNKEENENIETEMKLKKSLKVPKKCEICHQLLDDTDLRLYQGHPHNAVEEFVALTDSKLSLFDGTENEVHEDDSRPSNKVTLFNIYDKEGHLCPIDSGLIERNVLIYFSGYVKPIYEEDPSPDGGIPTKDIGPINEWWVSGYDGGEKALIGFSTAYGEYYLMEPSEDYAPLMNCLKEKIYMGKLVIEFLLDEINPSYEDLLNKIQTSVPPPGMGQLTEDSLLKHSQFVCDQVVSFDAASPGDDEPLITTPCMRALIHYAGITFGKRQVMRRGEKKQFKEKKVQWTKATTTPLVKNVFETFFTDQLDLSDNEMAQKRKRCGVCDACQLPDCGSCKHCLNMTKFGGTGTSKQACLKRKCPNMAVAEADDSEPEDEDFYQAAAEEKAKNIYVTMRSRQTGSGHKLVEWIGEPVADDGKRIFYKSAKVGETILNIGDCVAVEPANLTSPAVIGKISYMWQNQFSQKYMHAAWFCRSSETVLGETGDIQELFIIDECENTLLSGVTYKVSVHYQPPPASWKTEGGNPVDPTLCSNHNDKEFFYKFRYNETSGRFEDVLPDPVCQNKAIQHRFCASCKRVALEERFITPVVDEKLEELGPKGEAMYGVVRWKDQEYRPGTCVFLCPGAFNYKTYGVEYYHWKPDHWKKDKLDMDEEVYSEFYRKGSDYVKGSNEETPQPFCIGLITAIVTNSKDKMVAPSDICIRVVKFYRPENTIGITTQYHRFDLNMLYASEEEKVVNFRDVAGLCSVIYRENLVEDWNSWVKAGPNRFYFTDAYDPKKREIIEPSKLVKQLGDVGKGGGKGKGKKSLQEKPKKVEAHLWPKLSKPLQCLDVFAGCGGLSEGLHQAEIGETKWAIEKEEPAAHAFKLNNPKCTVFTEDCNVLLKMVMSGEEKTSRGQKLPKKGEVELLVGGPPCQGFSGMNRFNSRQYSLFKNSLIVSYLSYCEYYRPRFFILENVRNFVSFKNSMVLKLTLRCLIRMGYQVAFGILQAGNYGVPQTRRRAIVMAAAPGETLPNFPEPTHVFSLRASQLTVMVGDKKYISNIQWEDSAPYRTITVRDSMSDLPEIRNGANQEEIPYGDDAMTHFQKMMRGDEYQSMLRDHICKEMSSLVTARIAHIPTASGSDWRDLPNISVKISDETYTKKLQYTHHDKKNGRSSTGSLRGVCSCASGKACDPMDRQFNTLIPWCLPHTGNRHNHWAGLYGRLEWDGFFSTTVTNPEPMGKQGRVLHPEQTRVVSVRECARSQGFPDKYRFYGNILNKHRQIGNAVPPPMGAAIGREIRRCVALHEENEREMVLDE